MDMKASLVGYNFTAAIKTDQGFCWVIFMARSREGTNKIYTSFMDYPIRVQYILLVGFREFLAHLSVAFLSLAINC